VSYVLVAYCTRSVASSPAIFSSSSSSVNSGESLSNRIGPVRRHSSPGLDRDLTAYLSEIFSATCKMPALHASGEPGSSLGAVGVVLRAAVHCDRFTLYTRRRPLRHCQRDQEVD
jgi:hypothetical protein